MTERPWPWRPISLDPDSSLSSILALLPAIAMLALTVRIPSTQSARLVVAFCVLSVALAFGIWLFIVDTRGLLSTRTSP